MNTKSKTPTQTETDQPEERTKSIFASKSVRELGPWLDQLPLLSDHPNRQVQTRHVFVAYLVAFFNPTLRALRPLEDFSKTRPAQQFFGLPKLSKSAFGDAQALLDPTVLEPILDHVLQETAQQPLPAADDLPGVVRQVLAVDGTFLPLVAEVVWAIRHGTVAGTGRTSARLDCHFDVHRFLPQVVDVHGSETSEPAAAAQNIVPGAIHVYDRGYFDFQLINKHLELSREEPTPFVLRMRHPGPRSPKLTSHTEHPLSDQDRRAGVQSDASGQLAGSSHRKAPEAPLREVVIAAPDQPGGQVRLLTNLENVPAHVIGTLYRYRWQVELFFRWLKTVARFRHLLSQCREAVLFEVYVAVIGTLLLALRWNARPSKYSYALLQQVACGGASAEEVLPILAERERQCARDRASQRRRRARKRHAESQRHA